jgi:uncharacterized cupredoxin-like copper-binding protein
MVMKYVRCAALVAACLILTACASPAASSAGNTPQNITVQALDTMRFDPSTLTVKAGAPVHLTLNNSGALVHDWVIDNLDGKRVQVEAAGGASASVDFTPTRAGTYQFYCAQPGHKEAGMIGTLTVQ